MNGPVLCFRGLVRRFESVVGPRTTQKGRSALLGAWIGLLWDTMTPNHGVVAKTWYGVAPMCVLEYCAQNIERHELFEAWNRVRYGVFWPKIDFASTSLYTKKVSFGVWGGNW